MFNLYKKSFEDTLGGPMAAIVAEARFQETIDEDSLFSHRYQEGVHLDAVDPDVENREAVVQHYLKFFEELFEKLQLEAAQLYSDIVIRKDFTIEFLDILRELLEKAMGGDPHYVGYLGGNPYPTWEEYTNRTDEQMLADYTRSVEVAMHVAITRRTEAWPPELVCVVLATAWEKDPVEPNRMRQVKQIELRRVGETPPPPIPDSEEEDDGE